MAWLRLDDGFPEHRKVLALPRKDRWTWLETLAYVARQNNGGHVPNGVTGIIRSVTKSFLCSAVSVGLLDINSDGYVVHDWDVYNPKDPTNSERQRRYRNANRNAEITATVTAGVTPPARARARGPSPTPNNPSPTPPPEEEENENDQDQNRMQAWLDYAAQQPGITATLPYARKGHDTGAWPPQEQRSPNPSTECHECGERLGHGHADDCPVLASAAKRALAEHQAPA